MGAESEGMGGLERGDMFVGGREGGFICRRAAQLGGWGESQNGLICGHRAFMRKREALAPSRYTRTRLHLTVVVLHPARRDPQ